jgi:hypothetical protein
VILLFHEKTMQILRIFGVKRTAPWLARLAFFALMFQVSAIDHHTHVEDVMGIVGSSQHAMHCHGAVGTCVSGATEQPSILTQTEIRPTTPTLVLHDGAEDDDIPADALLKLTTEPPRI